MDFPVCRLFLNEQEHNTFVYTAEDEPYLTVTFDTAGEVDYKRHSDGDILPDPFIQQILFVPAEDTGFSVLFSPRDGAVMRPGRAKDGQAVLSQQGKPLIYGVNGVYDFDSDTLISWYGFDWRYEGDAVTHRDGRDHIRIRGTVKAGNPVIINVRLQYYRRHLGFEFHNPRKFRYNRTGICGWASWEAYHSGINQDLIRESVAFLSKTLKPYGLQYIQIDDGYQSKTMPPEGVDSIKTGWLRPNEKFPSGHKGIVAAIREGGFKPALWTNAAINNETYAAKSGKCIVGNDGLPLKGPWIGYVFDCTEESVEEIAALYRELADTGYRYFKIDAVRHLLYDGLMAAVRQGLITNEEAIRRFRGYLGALRRGIGEENYLLSCWGTLSPNAGIVDAMRFSGDASASPESFLMQVNESARWHVTHGVLYRNDPDYLCLTMDDAPARALAGMASLNGYLYMISDDVHRYDERKLEIARKTMPATGAVTAETGPLDFDAPMIYYKNMVNHQKAAAGRTQAQFSCAAYSLWATHFSHAGRTWAVVQFIRTAGAAPENTISVSLADLGLDPAASYEAFDFWEQQALGRVTGNLRVETPAAFGSRVVALTPVRNGIELIGASRHISMDVVSVRDGTRKQGALVLSLEGIPGETFDYWFAAPEDVRCSCRGARAGQFRNGSYLKCAVSFTEQYAELSLT
jgi:alpha-galactosidase